jgi:NAD(P)-dependent dehydrogenase (short-subunit alcohol dehydrogenase family)
MPQQGRLSGSVAIVTAAGQGIGETIAKTFAREGASVALVDVNRGEVERVAKEIAGAGGTTLVLDTDVTRTEAVTQMVQAVVDKFGTVDILVNAAGGFHQLAPITEITDEEWDRVITLNLKTCFLCSRAVAALMIARKKGRIVNIASGSGIAPNPFAATYLPYGAAKAGMINFTKVLARDLGPYGITVNAISPGTTATPRVVKVRDEASRRKIAEQNPMRCLVEPQDSAEAALFLASAEARYITGVNLNVNAGNLM